MPVRHGGDLVVVAHGPDPLADVAARRLEGDQLQAHAAPEVGQLGLGVRPARSTAGRGANSMENSGLLEKKVHKLHFNYV